MSTETTNKKIKIDNGTTFGRTYTDKAVDELLKNAGGGGISVIELTDKNGTIASAQLGKINANPQNFAFKYSGKILLFTKADSTTYQYCNNTTSSSDNNVMTTSTLLTIESSTGVYTIAENVHNVVANSIHPANGGDLTNIQVGSKVYSIPSGGGSSILKKDGTYVSNEDEFITINTISLTSEEYNKIKNGEITTIYGNFNLENGSGNPYSVNLYSNNNNECTFMGTDLTSSGGIIIVDRYALTVNGENSMLFRERVSYPSIPTLPTDASTKNYTLNSVNGVLTWNTIGNGLEIKDGALDIKSNVVKINTYSIHIDKTEISTTDSTGILSFAESAITKMTTLFNLLAQNENNIFNIKVKINIADGTSFLIFMDYHKASAINIENIQGIVLTGVNNADYHMFKVNEYQSNANLQEYYNYLSSVDVVVNYY